MNPRAERRASCGHHERIYRVVRIIPEGAVATYGQVAAIAGRCTPRMVGYAVASVPPGTDVPWHRVINSRGEISLRGDGLETQMALLESEGVAFDADGRVDLAEFGWTGPGIPAGPADAELTGADEADSEPEDDFESRRGPASAGGSG